MNWLLSILVGICAAFATVFIGGAVADSWTRWLRISSHEGASAIYVVFALLLVAIVTVVLGIVIARGWLLSTPNFLSALATAVGLTGGTILILTGIVWLATDHPPKIDGRPLDVVAELRFPAGTTLEAAKAETPYVTVVRVSHHDSRGYGRLDFDAAREVEGRVIIPVTIRLETSAAKKVLHIGFADDHNLYFPLAFGPKPEPKDLQWTDWIVSARSLNLLPPAPGQEFALRYKIVVDPPPPPVLTNEQQEAATAAKLEAEMVALAPDAPLAQWLAFTRYGMPQPRIDAAIAAIRARPDYVADMTREMLEGTTESRVDALRAVEHIKPPPAELADGIAKSGRQIAQLLRELEKEPESSERYNALIYDISPRFSAWIDAARALQEANAGDFVPQLKEIIEPARACAESHAIRMDVVRVASFYLKKWAGISPLPGDPPPT